MALSINDIISSAVTSAAGKSVIPSNIKDKVMGGLSESILGSLTQTAAQPGGLDILKGFFNGRSNAATSPVTKLAGSLFAGNILSKLNLDNKLQGTLSGLVPMAMTKLSGLIKDQDGDGDVDINDIIIALKGGGSGLLGAATNILGGLLGRK